MNEHKALYLKSFQEAQLRHSKRMAKVMELLLDAKTHAQFKLLDILLREELEKRKEDKAGLVDKLQGLLGQAVEVLAHEITDETVIYFIQQRVERLKEVYDIPETPPPATEEPE